MECFIGGDGMFGIICASIMGAGLIGFGIKNSINSNWLRDEAKRDTSNLCNVVYYDAEGKLRDIKTNTQLFLGTKDGDDVYWDINHNVYHNMTKLRKTQWEREKTIKDAAYADEHNGEYYKVGYDFHKKRLGCKYKRYGLNVPFYVKRKITWNKDNTSYYCSTSHEIPVSFYFYMDIKTGLIDGLDLGSDILIEKYKNNKDSIDNFVNYFNKEQEAGGWMKRNSEPYAMKNFEDEESAFFLDNTEFAIFREWR